MGSSAKSGRNAQPIDINLSLFGVACAVACKRQGTSAIVGTPIKGKPGESRGHKASGLKSPKLYDSGVAGHSSAFLLFCSLAALPFVRTGARISRESVRR